MSMSREILERWYGELEILKRLDHPNIVKALNVPEGLNCLPMSNTPFICMEYCDGGDLRQVCGSEGRREVGRREEEEGERWRGERRRKVGEGREGGGEGEIEKKVKGRKEEGSGGKSRG